MIIFLVRRVNSVDEKQTSLLFIRSANGSEQNCRCELCEQAIGGRKGLSTTAINGELAEWSKAPHC